MTEIFKKIGGFVWAARKQLSDIREAFDMQRNLLVSMNETISDGFSEQHDSLSAINKEVARLDLRLNAVFNDVEAMKKALQSLTEEHRANHPL